MRAADAIDCLAKLAHDLWRDRMEQDGWTSGSVYDPASKRHDALVPFERLGAPDRRQALLGVTALNLLPELAGSIWYERGPARLLQASEMREGLALGWNTEDCPVGPGTPPEPGRVVAWRTDREGVLRSVTVVWSDGGRSEHDPEDRELRRLCDAPASPGGPAA